MAMRDSRKCVFCFHELQPADVCFENIDDTVDPTEDEVKWKYKRLLNSTIQQYDLEAMSRKPIVRFGDMSPDDFVVDSDTGFPLLWKQPMGDGGFNLPNPKRICAYCHMPLPEKFGKCPNVMIGFCGNSGSGKTVYMLSLLHDLIQVDDMSVTWDAALSPDKEIVVGGINYKDAYTAMYQGEDGTFQLPAATDPNVVLPPLVLDCMYRDKEFMITAYDMAGEGMKQPFYMARMATFLLHANGVVYLKDPDYFPGFEKAASKLNEHEFLDSVFSMISAGTSERGGQSAHIAITMTKIDMLLDKYGTNPEFQKIVGKMFDGEEVAVHTGGFNISQAMVYNRYMQNLYKWTNTTDHTILTLYARQKGKKAEEVEEPKGCLARLFGGGKKKQAEEVQEDDILQRAMLFGVSPLGRNANPHKDEYTGMTVVDRAPNGLHNADPVLWLLYCCGLFPARKMKTAED